MHNLSGSCYVERRDHDGRIGRQQNRIQPTKQNSANKTKFMFVFMFGTSAHVRKQLSRFWIWFPI